VGRGRGARPRGKTCWMAGLGPGPGVSVVGGGGGAGFRGGAFRGNNIPGGRLRAGQGQGEGGVMQGNRGAGQPRPGPPGGPGPHFHPAAPFEGAKRVGGHGPDQGGGGGGQGRPPKGGGGGEPSERGAPLHPAELRPTPGGFGGPRENPPGGPRGAGGIPPGFRPGAGLGATRLVDRRCVTKDKMGILGGLSSGEPPRPQDGLRGVSTPAPAQKNTGGLKGGVTDASKRRGPRGGHTLWRGVAHQGNSAPQPRIPLNHKSHAGHSGGSEGIHRAPDKPAHVGPGGFRGGRAAPHPPSPCAGASGGPAIQLLRDRAGRGNRRFEPPVGRGLVGVPRLGVRAPEIRAGKGPGGGGLFRTVPPTQTARRRKGGAGSGPKPSALRRGGDPWGGGWHAKVCQQPGKNNPREPQHVGRQWGFHRGAVLCGPLPAGPEGRLDSRYVGGLLVLEGSHFCMGGPFWPASEVPGVWARRSRGGKREGGEAGAHPGLEVGKKARWSCELFTPGHQRISFPWGEGPGDPIWAGRGQKRARWAPLPPWHSLKGRRARGGGMGEKLWPVTRPERWPTPTEPGCFR